MKNKNTGLNIFLPLCPFGLVTPIISCQSEIRKYLLEKIHDVYDEVGCFIFFYCKNYHE